MYKLRIYKHTGNLDHEEVFDNKEKMDKRYDELFRYNLFSLNPTAWKYNNNNWERILGY